METVGTIAIDKHLVIREAPPAARDMYGGALWLEVHDDRGAVISFGLDRDGCDQLRAAMSAALAVSEREYADARSPA